MIVSLIDALPPPLPSNLFDRLGRADRLKEPTLDDRNLSMLARGGWLGDGAERLI